MKKKKRGKALKKALGGIKETETTTYDESGEVIHFEKVTTEQPYSQIIPKLIIGVVIVLTIISMLSKFYTYYIRLRYSLPTGYPYSQFFNPMGDILFLIFLLWIYSFFEDDKS